MRKVSVEGIVLWQVVAFFLALLRCASKHNIWIIMLMLGFILHYYPKNG
jgi:hypothetical protein